MSSRRVLRLVLVLLGTCAVAGGLVLQFRLVTAEDRSEPVDAAGAADVSVRGGAAVPEVAVLTGWDRRRASAYSTGDVASLRELYRPGSATGAADVRLLEAYVDRGLRVRGMRMQILALDVVASGPRRVVLDVTDRLVGAVAVRHMPQSKGDGADGVALPSDLPDRRRVVMHLVDGAWVVAEIRRVGAS